MLFASRRRPRAWKSGNGTTSDIASSPSEPSIDDFLWRVSIATIDRDVSISHFAGADRWVVPTGSRGLEILTPRGAKRVRRFEVFAFAGEDPVRTVKVAEPSRVLSLMVRRGVGAGSITVLRVSGRVDVTGDVGMSMIVVIDGTVVLQSGVALGPEDALMLTATDAVTLGGQATIAVVRVAPAQFEI